MIGETDEAMNGAKIAATIETTGSRGGIMTAAITGNMPATTIIAPTRVTAITGLIAII
jgi:hypothetical protein